MSNRRVAITGMGIVSSAGIGVSNFWDSLREGRSGVRYLKAFDQSSFANPFAGEVSEFDPKEFMDIRSARRNGRATQFAIAAAQLALKDSALDVNLVDKDRVGVVIGSSVGNLGFAEQQYHIILEKGFRKANPFIMTSTHPSSFSGHISVLFGFHGITETIHTACSSGASAIGLAYRYIRNGYADIMLAGGAEAPITPFVVGSFSLIDGILSQRKSDPSKAMRPFSADRDGLVLGEGSAVLILEDYDRAMVSGRRIYSEIIGYGTTSDGFHRMVQAPDGDQYARAIGLSLQEAGIGAGDVDYVIPHASATSRNDPAETGVIKKALGARAYEIPISATKPITGHTLGACGAFEAVAMNLCIVNAFVHPTINYTTSDAECDLDYAPISGRKAQISIGLSINCGFGGVNTAILFKATNA